MEAEAITKLAVIFRETLHDHNWFTTSTVVSYVKIIINLETLTKETASLGGLEPPTFRLTAERANRLRHRDWLGKMFNIAQYEPWTIHLNKSFQYKTCKNSLYN